MIKMQFNSNFSVIHGETIMFDLYLGEGLDDSQGECFTRFDIGKTNCLSDPLKYWKIREAEIMEIMNYMTVKIYGDTLEGDTIKDVCCAGWYLSDCVVEEMKHQIATDVCSKAADLVKNNLKNKILDDKICVDYPYHSEKCGKNYSYSSAYISTISFSAIVMIFMLRLLY